MKTRRALAVILGTFLQGVSHGVEWRLVETRYPTPDLVVAGLSVLDFGADSSGHRDATAAFQEALDRMGEAGGGTVFVPEGYYRLAGNLEVPVAVTLRGEWRAPTASDPAVRGTVLMPMAGRGIEDGTPFLTLDRSSGIKDLNIWYPDQDPVEPVAYPYTAVQKGFNNATFENLTLVNSYQGIRIGPEGNELHLVRNVYGTPMKTGVWYDSTTDIGRLQGIHFSPRWWKESGLPGAPRELGWIRRNGTAIFMGRSDWEYVADVTVEGYYRGLYVARGARGAANAQFLNLVLRDCEIGMEVEETNPYGMVFTRCHFEGTQYGVLLDKPFDSTVMFSNCTFAGEEALRSDGSGKIFLEQCRIARGKVVLEAGVLSALATEMVEGTTILEVGEGVEGVILADGAGQERSWQLRGSAEGRVLQTESVVELHPLPDYPENLRQKFHPAGREMVVVEPSGKDDTPRIQEALRDVARNGGGIVFLPAGDYRISGSLEVPSGVELRGVHDVPHHTSGGGTTLHVLETGDRPTVVLRERSGLRGLGFNYPGQSVMNPVDYPFLIQGQGSDIHVINVNAANPFRFLDLMTHRCDNHYIDYPSGAPLKTGIAVGGGSQGGVVQNMQFNSHYWSRSPEDNPYFRNRPVGGVRRGTGQLFWEYQKENLDALVIGNCERQFLYQNFVFGSLYGIHFIEEEGKGAVDCISHGHGTDGSKIGAFFEHGHGTVTLVNSELVAMSSEDKIAIVVGENFDSEATLINTMVWGQPNLLGAVANGVLQLQNLHANEHGDGFRLNGGKLIGENLSFNQRPGRFLRFEAPANVALRGLVFEGKAPAVSGDAVIELVIER